MGLGLIGWKESWAEFKTPNFWRDCFIEFYVTFMLLFVHLLLSGNKDYGGLAFVLIIGMLVFSNIEAYGHVQLAVMHPVVAVNFMFMRKISFFKCFFYIVYEILAAVCVAYFIKLVLPPEIVSTFSPAGPAPGLSGLQAMTIEWIIVIAHQSAILGSLDAENRPVMIPGLTIGMATFATAGAAFKFSGGVLNPVVVFHTAIISGDFSTQWIYWSGDFLGGLTALALYHFSVCNKGIFKGVTHSEDKNDIDSKDKLLGNLKDQGQTGPRNDDMEEFDLQESRI